MGNNNSGTQLKIYNCSGIDITVISPSGVSVKLHQPNLDCVNYNITYETGNYTINWADQSDTLLGSSLIGYSTISFWYHIDIESPVYNSKCCGSNAVCTKNYSDGIHLDLEGETALTNNNGTITQVDYSTIIGVPIVQPDTPVVQPDTQPNNKTVSSHILIWVVLVIIIISLVIGMIYVRPATWSIIPTTITPNPGALLTIG